MSTIADTTAKFTLMHERLDKPIEQIIAAIDNGGTAEKPEGGTFSFSPALFAGLCAAKVLLAHAQYTELGELREAGWDSFRARLRFAVGAATDAEDAGSPSQWGLWDGLHFAAVEAGRIDGDTVLMDGSAPEDKIAPGADDA